MCHFFFNLCTAVSGVGSSPALATCETSQVLLVGVPGVSFYLCTAVSGVGSSPALATCETGQVLLAGVPGVFSRGSHLLIGPSHMS